MHSLRPLRVTALYNCLALALGLACCVVHAGSTVVSCVDDNSADSLRSLLANPGNGAVINVAACSTISVTQGEIPIPASVTLQGPANGSTSIVGNHTGRIFRSTSLDVSSNALTL